MATLKPNLDPITQVLQTDNLGGPGPIAYDDSQQTPLLERRKELTDYIRFRLGDGMIDVELDPDHYKVAIDKALARYRQRAGFSQEESYAFLELKPEVQEYILPKEIMEVRAVYRRGIGSVTGTTASQFEPFASGYLNTYMLVAGRVGGLVNYELFVSYQKLAMTMFGGFMNFTWNRTTKKLTLIRKIPDYGHKYIRIRTLTADTTEVGGTITIETEDPWTRVQVGDPIVIRNCPISGYNGNYVARTVSQDLMTVTIDVTSTLANTAVVGWDLRKTETFSPETDDPAESVLLWCYNYKPDSMILDDHMVYPWIQDYALALCKDMLGQAREKFAQIAGPQGGSQLNGAALKTEAKAEMEALEEELKRFVDGSQPYTWITG